jgi:hypothetical protein
VEPSRAEDEYRLELEEWLLERRMPRPGEYGWETGPLEPRQFFERRSRVTIDEVRLEGEYPDTIVIIAFHRLNRPWCRFAWGTWLWNEAAVRAGRPDSEGVFWAHILEAVDTHPVFRGPCRDEEVRVRPSLG